MTSCFTLAGCKGDKEVPSTMDTTTREAQRDAKMKSRNSAKLDPSPTVTQTFFPSDNDSTVTPRKGVKSKSGNRNRFSAPAATRRREDVREIPQSPILKFSPATTEGGVGENGRSTLPRAKSLTSDRRQREITAGRDITSPRSPEQERPTSQVHRADSVKLLQSPTVEWVLPPSLDDNGNPSKKSRSLDNSQRYNHGGSGPDGEAYTPTREAYSFLLPSPTINHDSHTFETAEAVRSTDRNDNESRSRNPDNSTQGVRSEAKTPNQTEQAENVHRHFEGPETNRISASSPLKTQEQGFALSQSPTINRPALLQQDEQMRKIDVTPVKAYQQKSMSLPRKASTPEKDPEHKGNVVKMPPSPIVSSPSPKLSYNKHVFPARSGKDEKVKTQHLLETDIDAVVEPPAEETVDSGNFDDKTKREVSNIRPLKPNTFPARFSENSERYLEEPVHYRQQKVVASPTKTNTGTAKAKREWRNSANLETGAVMTSPTAKARITPAKTLEDQPTPEMDTADPTPDSGYFDYRSLESKTIESPTKSEAEGNIEEHGNKTDQEKDTEDEDENDDSPFDNKPDAEDVDDDEEGGEDFEVVEKRATDVYTPDGCVSSEELVVRRRRRKSGKLQWSLQVNRKSWKTNQGLSRSQSMENLHTAGTDRRLSLQVEPTMKAVSSPSQAAPVFPGDKQTGAPTPNLSQKPKQGPKDPSVKDYSQADTPKQGQGPSGKYNDQPTRSSGDGEGPSTFVSPSQHPNNVTSPTPMLTNDNAQSNKKQPEDPSTFGSPSQHSNRVASPTTPSLLTNNAQSNKTQPDPPMTASTSPETTQSDSGKPTTHKVIPSSKSPENISSDTRSKSPENSTSAARSKSLENPSSAARSKYPPENPSAARSKSPENPSAARSKSPENSSSADTRSKPPENSSSADTRSKSPENSSPADTGSPDSNRVSPTATAIRTPSFFPYKKNPSPSSDIGRSLGTPNRPSSPPKGRQRPTASKTTPPQPSKREPSRSTSNSTEEPDSLPVDSATNGSKRGGNNSPVTAKDDKREAKTSPVNDDPSLTVQKLQSTPVSRLPEGPKVTPQDCISTASGDPKKHTEDKSVHNEDDSTPEEDGNVPEEILAADEASSTTVVSYTTRLWRVVLGPFGTARQYFCRLFQGPTRRGSWLILCALILIPIALDYRARRITATQDEV